MKKHLTVTTILLGLILVIALTLRSYRIADTPISLYWDEVALGYNAYSIAETGKDEYGVRVPVLFRSYDDYKFPGYVYITAPFVKVLGLNNYSTRLPSAIMGTLTVLFVYLLTLELFNTKASYTFKLFNTNKIITLKSINYKYFKLNQSHILALSSAFLIAIAPWHIQFSRAAFEANGSLFFAVLGAWLFLYGVNRNKTYYSSSLAFAISIYFYRGAFIFVPLLIGSFSYIYFRYLSIRKITLYGLLFLVVLAPLIFTMLSPEAQRRSDQVFIGNQKKDYLQESADAIDQSNNALWARAVHNRRLWLARGFVQNYSKHYSYDYLSKIGDPNLRHGISGMGMLYKWEIIFFILGFLSILFLQQKRTTFAVVSWLLFAPVAASLSYPTPHALRSIYMIPALSILIALGVVFIINILPKAIRYISIMLIVIIGLTAVYGYLITYYNIYRTASSTEWADGYFQLNKYVDKHKDSYDLIVITGHYWKPYMYTLFHTSYDPRLYQESGAWDGFDRYRFGGTSWGEGEVELDQVDILAEYGDKNVLFALSDNEYEEHKDLLRKVDTIHNTQGKQMFIISEWSQ